MREYLYLWHQPAHQCLIASGIEFRDLLPELAACAGLVLLRHQFEHAEHDSGSLFEYVTHTQLVDLAADDIYDYGDFLWADFNQNTSLLNLSDDAIAELTFFAHAARPLRQIAITGLGNKFLFCAHDDGFVLRLYYTHWHAVEPLLRRLLPQLLDTKTAAHTLESLMRGDAAYWIRKSDASICEQTEDIDTLQSRHRNKPR